MKQPTTARGVLDAAMTEREFQELVVQTAMYHGWRTYHTHDSRRSDPGFPDLVLVRDRVIFAELKSAAGKVRPEQGAWIDALRDAGADVHLWRPSDLDHIIDRLRRAPTQGDA